MENKLISRLHRINFCKDKNSEQCCVCGKEYCPSMSEFKYGILLELPIIKQIYEWNMNRRFDKEMKDFDKTVAKYGCCENDNYKLLFGIISTDDLSVSRSANLYTMNDIDLLYDKEANKYLLSIETIFYFKNKSGYINYLKFLLDEMTKFMVDNGYDINYKISMCELFSDGIMGNCEGDSVEECYAKFRILVDGYCMSIERMEGDNNGD